MKFLIVSNVLHSFYENKYFAYAPYVREMNLWGKNVNKLIIISPLQYKEPTSLDLHYFSSNILFLKIPQINILNIRELFKTIYEFPVILIQIFKGMFLADHIHLRCPCNIALIGVFAQIFFPFKTKTAKYAGNWDLTSSQPWSYRLQQYVLRNSFLSRNIKVLVYGDWNESRNIIPFFTATYSENEIIPSIPRKLILNEKIRLIYVGGLIKEKRPLLSLTVSKYLNDLGITNEIHFWGDGDQKSILKEFIVNNGMENYSFLHGNVDSKTVKLEFQKSHFLIFISESEGWPKVVAESMFWGCMPLASKVSCVEEMLGFGQRGDIVEPSVTEIVNRILFYLNNSSIYELKCNNAIEWSRIYTLEKFESEINKLLRN